jgi:hypothetical protein
LKYNGASGIQDISDIAAALVLTPVKPFRPKGALPKRPDRYEYGQNGCMSNILGLSNYLKFIKLRFVGNPTAALFLTACLPFEDFFASTPSAGPHVGDFAQKRLERLLGIGDDGVVFLLFQDLFHRTSVDVHEFHSIIRRSKFGRLIYFAAIVRGGAPVAFGRAPL